ncbi:MAG: ATP-binding protein [Desulfuromonadales bacterium]|nr:ATP-binding protein [Desulfuromonadales bacterium]
MSLRPNRLLWQIELPLLLILLLAIVSATWLFLQSINSFHVDQTRAELEARARLVLPLIIAQRDRPTLLQAEFHQLRAATDMRLTLIDRQGVVLVDSDEEPPRMDNHGSRPEVAAALHGEVGVATRFSHTLQQTMMYVAVPLPADTGIDGCLRTALPLASITRTLHGTLLRVIGSGMLIGLLATLFSLWLSRRISRPLEEMTRQAQRFATGELDQRLPRYGSEELGNLADSMNRMAAQLDERIRTIVRQRNEQEAVLASMIEGVIAIDRDETIIRLNQAASSLLNLDRQVVGRTVREVLRKPDLLQFIDRALASREPVEDSLSLLIGSSPRFLQAHGTPLRDARGHEIGVLIVFNDITRLQRLENIRRDFVANVSHELKTPITAIKGSVETLIGGALDDPDNAPRFLAIIARQSDRLNAIIEDLLALSRIEQEEEQDGIELRPAAIAAVVQGAVQACQHKAEEKAIDLDLALAAVRDWPVNAALLEQALVNLIDNAIKYSQPGERVRVAVEIAEKRLLITVRDWGQGIAAEHLPRLFERFYRIDKARSRSLGGTGLGLAIVKHIVQAHHGAISVDSSPGQGTIFTIVLPAR